VGTDLQDMKNPTFRRQAGADLAYRTIQMSSKRRILPPTAGRVWTALAAAGLLALAAGCGNESEARPGNSGPQRGGPSMGSGSPGPSARAIPVSARVVEPGTMEVTLRASTTLRAREQVEVVPKQSGIVSRLLVEEGTRVSEGELLAQLDDEEWRLQAQQAEARAQAALDAVERARALRDMELVPEQEVERLTSEARVAESELGLARLRVANAGIRAPVAGTITRRFIERGQQVNTSNPAFEVADLDLLEAHLAVPEREAARVQVGQSARLLTEQGGAPIAEGEVARIRPVVDPESGTVRVTVAVSARAGERPLRPGQFVNVDLVTETLSDRITLPRTSVLVDGAAPRVFVIRDGRAEEREVALGYSRGDRVEIRAGLEPGDTVVVVGQDNLRPEAPVRLMQLDGRAVESGTP
jgi:membrane fusion protein, multidrug efflux system